jgi:RNA polymerase sigma factor (sigma-70 family)
MPVSLIIEQSCLRRLRAGEDAWPEFLDLFGELMYWEVAKYGICAGHDRDDLLQDIALKLMAHDWAIVARHLDHHAEMTFTIVLRTIIRSCMVNMWRRNKHWRETEQLEDEPPLADIIPCAWASDPALAVYRDVRLMCLLNDLAGNDRDGRNFRILLLRFVEHESVIDIAREMGLSANAVTQRIRECLKRGRRVIGVEALRHGQGATR